MQTTPTATTAPTGQAPQPNGAAKAGDGSMFAALIQALTGMPAAATAPGTTPAGELANEATAATAEGETPVEDDADIDIAATAHLACIALPPPPAPAMAPVGDPTLASAGTPAPQPAAGMPGNSPLPAAPSASESAPQPAVPPSAQAVELAKLLGDGAQVRVTGDAGLPMPPPAPAANAVAVALALQDPAVAAAAEPLIRTIAPEPKKASSATTVPEPAAGEAVKTAPASEPAASLPEKSAGPAHHKAEAVPAPALAVADGSSATPAAPSSLGSASPGNPEAAAQEPAPTAVKAGESHVPASQSPAFASTAGTQPAATAPERAAPFALPAQPPAGQVSVHIAKAVRSGTDRIHIQLAPAALGRVEIALDLSDGQQVRATISAETKEALELLRADARVLERALQDAGLKADPGSLSFQLRDQGARPGHDGGSRSGYGAQPHDRLAPAEGDAAAPSPPPAPLASRGRGRIDIHA